MNGIGLYVFYINFCVERFEVSDNRRHTIYGSTLNDFSTIFFFRLRLPYERSLLLLLLRFFWFSFYQRQGKKFPSNGDGNSNSSVVTATAIVVTLVDFSVCMSEKGKIAQFIVSSRARAIPWF